MASQRSPQNTASTEFRLGTFSFALIIPIAVFEYVAYFWRAGHFFQGDTIYWFHHRLTSLHDFLFSFITTDSGGCYRPLTNRTVQSLLYPVLGFEPIGYRVVLFVLLLANTAAVLALSSKLTRKTVPAVLSTVFFAMHTVNAYVTYDLSFTPELAYSLFYLLAILAFFRYLESMTSGYRTLSVLCFALSLCSKEAAVTLPLTLLVLALIAGERLKPILISLIPHGALLVVYLLLTLGRLGVASEALASLHTPPRQLETGGYYFMIGPHVLTNAVTAWSWALNLPVGLLGEWRDATRLRSLVLWGFAGIQMALIVYAFLRRDWRPVLSGMALFGIAVLPALPLMGHFLPYYMFLPVVGFSVLVGATWNRLFEELPRRLPLAPVVTSLAFAALAYVCVRSSRSDAINNPLLGHSSRIAETSLQDLRRLYPTIPSGTVVFIDDGAQPDLPFHHAQGGLFKLAFRDESLQFKYSSQKEFPPENPLQSDRIVRLMYTEGHLRPAN